MVDHRLEQLLINLARRFAPALVPVTWIEPGDYEGSLPELATTLAGYNVLVLRGDVPPGRDATAAVTQWVEGYVRLYDLLTRALFPSFTQVSAYYADTHEPPIVVVQGTATPVIVVLAGYIAPYIAARQGVRGVSDFELLGLLDIVLEDLEAGDLPREQYRQLRDNGAALVRQLLGVPVRQARLTEPKRALSSAFSIAEDAAPMPEITPTGVDTAPLPPPMPPPDVLPEQDALSSFDRPTQPHPPAPKESASPFGAAIPMFFDPNARGKRTPPVPDLPE